MAVYANLGIAEVWEWKPDGSSIAVCWLVGDRYELRSRSEIRELGIEKCSGLKELSLDRFGEDSLEVLAAASTFNTSASSRRS